MFTPSMREEVLDHLVENLKTDQRIVSVILVGSGAAGFTDRFSDIDIVAVIDPQLPAKTVFQDWVRRFSESLPVVHKFDNETGQESFLAGFLLEGCLEVDLGFVSLEQLFAKKSRWKVLYDLTGQVQTRMEASWESRENENLEFTAKRYASTWHYIIQTVVSVQRNQLWRAVHNLEEVRNRSLTLAGMQHGLVVSHFRQIDLLPEPVRKEFEDTMVTAVAGKEIMRALRAAVGCYFRQMDAVKGDVEFTEQVSRTKAEMKALVSEFSVSNEM